MLTIFRDPDGVARRSSSPDLPEAVIWIDLIDPTPEETAFAESRAKVRVPTIDALSEIESSSRLATEDDAIYLSVAVVARGDTPDAFLSPTGFILTKTVLVTVRFVTLSTFDAVAERVKREPGLRSAPAVLVALLEAMVDRGADVLERLGAELAQVSKMVFRGRASRPGRLAGANEAMHRALIVVGNTGDRLGLARDALLGIGRIAPFVLSQRKSWIIPEFEAKLEAITKDIASLNDFEAHLSNKVQFLLDAILGFISIQQNDLFKVLTIVSVVGIPPTLMAGIYGMNFKDMPELNWPHGYAYGLTVIALSAIVPLAWFKWRGWF